MEKSNEKNGTRKKEETFRRCLASEDLLSSLATIELKMPIVKQSSLASIRSSIVSIDTVKALISFSSASLKL